MSRTRKLALAAAPLVLAALLSGASAARADEEYFPLQSYRIGPYAAGGTGFFGGVIGYMNPVNSPGGGGNRVKPTRDERENRDKGASGVEGYRRTETQGTP